MIPCTWRRPIGSCGCRAAEVSLEETLAWQAWIHEHPANAAAFARIEEISQALCAVPAPAAVPPALLARDRYDASVAIGDWKPRRARRWPRAALGVAASFALVALVFAFWKTPAETNAFETAIGENRSVTLARARPFSILCASSVLRRATWLSCAVLSRTWPSRRSASWPCLEQAVNALGSGLCLLLQVASRSPPIYLATESIQHLGQLGLDMPTNSSPRYNEQIDLLEPSDKLRLQIVDVVRDLLSMVFSRPNGCEHDRGETRPVAHRR